MSPNEKVDLVQLQKEIGVWRRHNFPDQLPHQPVLGVAEEIGELMDALLADDTGLAQDSIADITVYALNYCDQRGYPTPIPKYDKGMICSQALAVLSSSAGALSHAVLKEEQGKRGTALEHQIEGQYALDRLLGAIHAVCTVFRWDFDKIMTTVWNEVKTRDWVLFPFDGRTR